MRQSYRSVSHVAAFCGVLLLASGIGNPAQSARTDIVKASKPSSVAETPERSRAEIESYLRANEREIGRKLHDYNSKHRIAISNSSVSRKIRFDWKIRDIEPARVFLVIRFEVGGVGNPARSDALFELAWRDGELEFVNHYEDYEETPPAITATAPADSNVDEAAAAPEKPRAKVEAYFRENEKDLGNKLIAYNSVHKLAHSNAPIMQLMEFDWEIVDLQGDRVSAAIKFTIGNPWNPGHGRAIFDLAWDGEELVFVGHRRWIEQAQDSPNFLEPTEDRGCIQNYYSHRPCIDTLRKWREFAEVHDLTLDRQSASIYQAYKQGSTATGDRLMARARGLPDPAGETVFAVQAEITRLDLTRYQRNAKVPCDINPFGPKPCPEVLRLFREFAERHGLAMDRRTGNMFEAYAHGDYKKADVVYALAKGLPVPAYGYIPTSIARDAAIESLEAGQMRITKIECDTNPYRTRPCPGALRAWREFAERYGLEDNIENATIFQAYAEGEYRVGDRLFAQAKGVSVEQLREAAGVPGDGLVIEVFPGPAGASGS